MLKLKVNKQDMLLYVVTDRSWLGDNSLDSQVEDIIKSGATFIQLREKSLDFETFVSEGKKIKQVTDRYNIPFVINDNIEVALAIDADGVHVGQSDMNAGDCRKLLGDDKILGVSAATVEQALFAQQNGADYIGVGAVFQTSTKTDAKCVSHEVLQDICNAVNIPVVAIGGINQSNILNLKGSGVDGVAVISAVFGADDIKKATEELTCLSKEIVR